MVAAGYRWHWQNGLNLHLGLGAHYSPELISYPDAASSSGQVMPGESVIY
jgi:hypothetical protein